MRLALLPAACLLAGGALAAEKPSIVLVTLDTARADRMGFLGHRGGLTPSLDALARRAVVFERAYSQAPITTVSHATILSGTLPQFHGVNDFGVSLPAALPYLPDLARASGYHTAAFVGSLILDPRAGLAPGFDRGFEVYDAGYRVRRGRRDDRYATMERRAEDVVARAIRWLESRPPGPFLLWVHLYDPHDPYEPPEPFAKRFAANPYDGEIAYADAQVGRLLAALEAAGRFDPSLIAVFADHGESLGQHGEKTHGVFLYDATIHVPLVVKLPAGRGAGQRVGARASLVDLAPSVLDAVGLPRPSAMQGESLLPLVGAANAADRASYAETDYPRRAFGWSALQAWRVERFLYVQAPRRELYDLATDPAQGRDLASERALLADRIGTELQEFRKRTAAAPGAEVRSEVDPGLAEKLAALGYVSGGSAPSSSGVDPKDKVAVANRLHDAILAIENGEPAAAAGLLEQVVASDPQIHMAQLQLGIARCRERRYREAIPALRKAIELQPDAVMAHYEMGIALFETGDWKTAAGHLEIVASRMPRFADARFSLGSLLARTQRLPEAARELRAALELEPDHYRANLLLGRLLDLQGRSGEGLPCLERAAANPAASAEAFTFLAEALDRLGRPADAERAREKAAGRRARP